MIKNILTDISGIELFPIISLLLFVAVFASVLIQVLRMDNQHLEAMGTLPLDSETRRTSDSETRNPGDSHRA